MNWPALMSLGLGRLRLAPDVFWSMTPQELRAALSPFAAPPPITRAVFDTLAALHPDTS